MRYLMLITVLFLSMQPVIHAQSIEGNYAIKNLKTGKLLRPEGANKADMTNIVLYTPTNWKCLTWEFIPVSDETYQLKNLFTSKTFYGTEAENGIYPLKQVALQKNDPEQSWTFERVEEGVYRIRLKERPLYITPMDDTGMTNTHVVLAPKTAGELQLWTIYEQDPKY